MICFRDRTFCKEPSCDCGYEKWTDELEAAAERWWNPFDKPELRGQAPVCFIEHREGTKCQTPAT